MAADLEAEWRVPEAVTYLVSRGFTANDFQRELDRVADAAIAICVLCGCAPKDDADHETWGCGPGGTWICLARDQRAKRLWRSCERAQRLLHTARRRSVPL